MATMRDHKRWSIERRAEAYSELEHPSDLFLEIRGANLSELFEHALFAFYDQIAETAGFEARREVELGAHAAELDEALRALLSEALFHFETEGFVAVQGGVAIAAPQTAAGTPQPAPAAPRAVPPGDHWRLSAHLWGENADRKRHTLLHEVKAVTYHRLGVSRTGQGWKATVLLDL
jgi:SHS2 domain-containing protein